MTSAHPTSGPSTTQHPLLSPVFTTATLAGGADQILEFAIPLFAGELLGLSAAEMGVLLAVGLLFSFVIRSVAGICADRFDRR